MTCEAIIHSRVFSTPHELRQIADAMEQRCRTICWGENATVFSWHGSCCCVDMLISQELLPAKPRPDAESEGAEEASPKGDAQPDEQGVVD